MKSIIQQTICLLDRRNEKNVTDVSKLFGKIKQYPRFLNLTLESFVCQRCAKLL